MPNENPKGDNMKVTCLNAKNGYSIFSFTTVLMGIRNFRTPFYLEAGFYARKNKCTGMYAHKAYIINGKTMKIGLNQQIQFAEITVIPVMDGARIIYIYGKQHVQMLEIKSVKITVSQPSRCD